MREKTVAVVVAAGGGARFGGEKQFASVGGVSVLSRAVGAFAAAPAVDGVVVVAPEGREGFAQELVRHEKKLLAVVPGGLTRADSVYNGLRVCDGAGNVLIHDAARPLVSARVIEDVARALEGYSAVVPFCDVTDTVLRVKNGFVSETPSREGLVAAQTPQGFRYSVIMRAHERRVAEGDEAPTDDAGLVRRYGLAGVFAVPGDARNIKLTHPWDLALAETLLETLKD